MLICRYASLYVSLFQFHNNLIIINNSQDKKELTTIQCLCLTKFITEKKTKRCVNSMSCVPSKVVEISTQFIT